MAIDDPLAQPPVRDEPRARTPSDPRADAPPSAGDQLLPCGHPVSRAWEDARAAASAAKPHTAACPHCREATHGLVALDTATRALRAQKRPSAQPLADRVMGLVRADVRRGRMLPLDDTLQLAETAAAKVLRRAADAVAGATVASLRLAPGKDARAVHIALTLVAALDRPLPATADQVRQAVLQAGHRMLGLAITSVDVTVVDVVDPARTAW